MKKGGTALSILLITIVAAYLAFMPRYLSRVLPMEPSLIRAQQLEEPAGIIKVWHIAGFKPYSGSGGSWLKSRADVIEKQHYGLFFDVVVMDTEEYLARTARGERADVYCFPLGLIDAEQLMPLELDKELRDGMQDTGAYGGKQLAVPVYMSGYALIENTMLAQKRGSNTAGSKNASEAFEKMPENSAIAGCKTLLAEYAVKTNALSKDEFLAQKCAYGLLDFRVLTELSQLSGRNKGFVYSAYPAPGFNDLVQLIGIDRDTAEIKRQAGCWLIESALSDKGQTKLTGLGLLGTTDAFDYESLPDEIKTLVADAKVPNSFAYYQHKSDLDTACDAALLPGADGRMEFDGIMEQLELVYISQIK